jgi:hypothetical protein
MSPNTWINFDVNDVDDCRRALNELANDIWRQHGLAITRQLLTKCVFASKRGLQRGEKLSIAARLSHQWIKREEVRGDNRAKERFAWVRLSLRAKRQHECGNDRETNPPTEKTARLSSFPELATKQGQVVIKMSEF